MKKRFIVLIDYPDYSENLILYACDWSKQANAELLLVHQTTVLSSGFLDNEGKQSLIDHANTEALHGLKEAAKKLIPQYIDVAFKVSEGHLQKTISELLIEPYENLFFVGLKGTGVLKKLILGSTALNVIENTDNIVVAMPEEINTFTHKKIFVAVKIKYPLNIIELKKFLGFIEKEDTSITFFYLAKPDEDTGKIRGFLRELTELFSERFNTHFEIYEGKTPFADIEKVINNKIDELLVVQKGSRLLTDQFFRRYLINHLVYKGQTPLVVLP